MRQLATPQVKQVPRYGLDEYKAVQLKQELLLFELQLLHGEVHNEQVLLELTLNPVKHLEHVLLEEQV